MRLWEFGDNKAAQFNMMFEQDFILHVRRLKQRKVPHIVANLKLSEAPTAYGERGPIEDAHARLNSFMQSQKGSFAPMPNGDVFLTWEVSPANTHLVDQTLRIAFPKSTSKLEDDKYLQLYKLPDDYVKIRTIVDEYINDSKPVYSEKRSAQDCIQLLKGSRARGVLSAWTLDQIESLVKKIDVYHYIRSQPIYRCVDADHWERICDEAYIGFNEFRQTYFPHTDVSQPKHLFLELCQLLDGKVLTTLTENYDSVKGMPLSLNLSISTVLGVDFATFARTIPAEERNNFGFEIHCGDLLQDFEITLNMIDTMREEGFHLALDGVSPNMLEYFDFSTLNMDAIKIDVRKDYTKMLGGLKTQKAIMMIDPDKVIFSHCDTEEAIEAGLRLGVSKFQGFLVDDLALERLKAEESPLAQK